MSFDDELKSHLAGKATAMEVEPVTVGEAQARGHRRARRTRTLGVFGMFVLIVGVAIGIRPFMFEDDSVTDVAVGDIPGTTTTFAAAPLGDSTGSTDSGGGSTELSRDQSAGDLSASSYYGEGGDWVVPWGDGFLWIGNEWEPASLPGPDSEFAQRFPAEIVDAVIAAGAVSLDDAVAALSDAGLLELATNLVSNDPELLQIYEEMLGGGSTINFARISSNGSDWSDLPGFRLPFDGGTIDRVSSDGSHLIVSSQVWNNGDDSAGPTAASVFVAVTTDLLTWQVHDLTASPANGPYYLRTESWLSGLAIGPDRWIAVVRDSSYIDTWSLIPAEVRDWPGGVNYSETDEGVEVTLFPIYSLDEMAEFDDADEGGAVTSTGDDLAPPPIPLECCEPEEIRFFTWEELGVDPTEYKRLSAEIPGRLADSVAWFGLWDSEFIYQEAPNRSALTAPGLGVNRITGTDAGFMGMRWGEGDLPQQLVFSTDGVNWESTETPAGELLGSVVAVDGGVVVTTDGPDGTNIWLGSSTGTGWQQVELPEALSGINVSFGGNGNRGAVSLYDLTEYSAGAPPSVDFESSLDVDGMSLVLSAHSDGTADLLITDIETGDVVAELTGAFDGLSADFAQLDGEGVTIIDDDGIEIVVIPIEMMIDTLLSDRQAAIDASGWVPPPPSNDPPELWILASADGITWTSFPFESLAGSYEWPSVVGISGHTVVVRTSSGWQSFPIN